MAQGLTLANFSTPIQYFRLTIILPPPMPLSLPCTEEALPASLLLTSASISEYACIEECQ